MRKLPKCDYHYLSAVDPQEDSLRKISYANTVEPKNKKIVLIIPPSPQVPTPGREFLVTGPFEGFTYIATLIKKLGYQLGVVDCRLKEGIDQLVLDGTKDADLIGISTYCDSFVFLQEITQLIKKQYPGKFIFFGGPLVTSLPEIILNNTSADCAILGEGELTLIEFLDKYFTQQDINFSQIKGMAYKDDGQVLVNPLRPQIKNLDNLPLLDYTIWPNYESIVKNGQILISSTRGCAQECSFCFKTIPGIRLKSLRRFEQEVAYLKKVTKFNYTWLNDLTFNVIEKRAIEICSILKKYAVQYHVFARVQKVTKRLAEALKKTGCLGIWFGIESYDQGILDANRKNIKIKDIDSAVRITQDAGLLVRGLFIVGLYGETEKSLQEMVAFIKKSRFLPLVKYLVPFPGTSLYKYAVESGKITDTVAFLKMLSGRKVSDYDDEIINLTDLKDGILRNYFHQIWEITKERERCFESPQEHFVKRAGKYNHSSHWVDDTELIKKIQELACAGPQAYVLDMAIGTGKIAEGFRGKVKLVVGVDICFEMAQQAKKYADEIVLAPVENLPFKNDVFDACVCRQGLQFMELDSVFPEITRILKPGGRLVLCHLTAYGKEDQKEAFAIQRLRNPARKNFFLAEDFLRLLEKYHFGNIESFEYLSKESVNQWIDNGALDEGTKDKIREIYKNSSDDFKRIHNLQFEEEDIFDRMKMFIVKAVKKG